MNSLRKQKKCKKQKCVCGDQEYNVKIAIPSVFYEDENIDYQDDCDIYGMIYRMQYQLRDYQPVDEAVTQKIVRRAKKEIGDLKLNPQTIPARFDFDELIVGPLLGSGGFSNVVEISKIQLSKKKDSKYSDVERRRRADMVKECNTKKLPPKKEKKGESPSAANHVPRKSHLMPPYVMKHLRSRLVRKTKKFANGAIDLTLEAAFLSSLNHPNILKIHGVASDGPDAYARGRHDSYFLILDRLHETLHERIVTWRKEHKHLSSVWGRMTDNKGRKQDKLTAERLKVAFDIASALNYLHSRGLLYRDLKPANIGFGLDDEVKLFDFGLCRELPEGADNSLSAVYKMSGGVGTYRYMSPEVCNREMYNQGADVYSFGMVLYEMVALNQPAVGEGCKTVNPDQLRMCLCWPESIKRMLFRMWSLDISKRPTMKEICVVLKRKITELRQGDSSGLNIPSYSVQGCVMDKETTKRFATFRLDDATVGTASTSSKSYHGGVPRINSTNPKGLPALEGGVVGLNSNGSSSSWNRTEVVKSLTD